MPVLVAVAGHVGGGADDLADEAVVDDLAAGHDAGAEDGVGGGAGAELALFRLGEDGFAFLVGEGVGLFAVGVLAGAKGAEIDGGVDGGDGEVEDGVDIGIGDELVDGEDALDLMLGGALAGAFRVEVAAGGDAGEVREGSEALEVGVADGAAADEAEAEGSGGCPGGFGGFSHKAGRMKEGARLSRKFQRFWRG